MIGVEVTSTANSVKAKLNDYQNFYEHTYATWNKSSFYNVKRGINPPEIIVRALFESELHLNFDGTNNCLKIESVEGVIPTDNDHLFNLLQNILA